MSPLFFLTETRRHEFFRQGNPTPNYGSIFRAGQAETITFTYDSYDKVGNRMSCQIDDANAHCYTYDVLYQLTEVDYNDGCRKTGYSYDAVGNRTQVDINRAR